MIRCLLCDCVDITLIETIQTSDLIYLYKKGLRIDVNHEFGDITSFGYYRCQNCDLSFFYPPIYESGQFYETLQKFDWYYLEEKSEYDFARKFIKSSDRVLELGCGKGDFALHINPKEYLGLEINDLAVQRAAENGITVINQNVLEHAAKNSGKYDVVCAFQVLEHISELKSFLDGCTNCLRPGGLLIFSVPSEDGFLSKVSNNPLNMPPHHSSRWTDKALYSIAGLLDLSVSAIEHESLSAIHQQWFAHTLVLQVLRNIFGKQYRLIDLSVSYKALSSIAKQLGKLMKKNLSGKTQRNWGHSVTIVFRKNS